MAVCFLTSFFLMLCKWDIHIFSSWFFSKDKVWVEKFDVYFSSFIWVFKVFKDSKFWSAFECFVEHTYLNVAWNISWNHRCFANIFKCSISRKILKLEAYAWKYTCYWYRLFPDIYQIIFDRDIIDCFHIVDELML